MLRNVMIMLLHIMSGYVRLYQVNSGNYMLGQVRTSYAR